MPRKRLEQDGEFNQESLDISSDYLKWHNRTWKIPQEKWMDNSP